MGKMNNRSHFTVIARLIKWVGSSKRLWLLIALLSFLGGGYLFYSNYKEIILRGLDAYGDPGINTDRLDGEAVLLSRDTEALSVIVWKVNLDKRSRVLTYLRVNGVRSDVTQESVDVGLRPNSALTSLLIDLLNQDITCFHAPSLSEVSNMLNMTGATYACAVSIPPHHSTLMNVLLIGFSAPPNNEKYIRERLRMASEKLSW